MNDEDNNLESENSTKLPEKQEKVVILTSDQSDHLVRLKESVGENPKPTAKLPLQVTPIFAKPSTPTPNASEDQAAASTTSQTKPADAGDQGNPQAPSGGSDE